MRVLKLMGSLLTLTCSITRDLRRRSGPTQMIEKVLSLKLKKTSNEDNKFTILMARNVTPDSCSTTVSSTLITMQMSSL